MASQSLYRKWRSQTFGDLVGQEPVIRTLKNALSSGSLAHAYLFTGPRGTGKTSTARLLAKTINCLQPTDGEPCNTCEQCREITAGNSFNVIEIDAASNRGIDSIRELREKVMVPPSTGKYKVYILDEAHMLTVEAFNALLKTLEEPPAHAIFVMATTDVHKMLPTVLSRCQRFDFKRFTTQQLVNRLRHVSSHEQITLEPGAAELIARAAAGGMRDALSLLDQAIAYSGQVISLAQVQSMLGVADPRAIQKFIGYIADLDSPTGLHLIHELSEAGADLRQINTQVAEYFRAMMLARAGAAIAEILDLTEDELRDVREVSNRFALEELTECARIFAQNELVQKSQGTPQLGLELAFLNCLEIHRRTQSGQPLVPSNTAPAPTAPSSLVPSQDRTYSAGPASSVRPVPSPALTIQNPPVPPVAQAPTANIAASFEQETRLPETEIGRVTHVEEESVSSTSISIAASPPLASVPPAVQPVETAVGGMATDQAGLTVAEVKEKWELIKRRVRSKRDGAKIAAFLNGFFVAGVEGTAALPIILIRANMEFHYKSLQNESHHTTIEWAMKIELQKECKLRLLPPDPHGGAPVSTRLPPSDPYGGAISALGGGKAVANNPIGTPPPQAVHREYPASALPPASEAKPFQPLSQMTSAPSALQEGPATNIALASAPVEPVGAPTPLARNGIVGENRGVTPPIQGGTRREVITKKAKSDHVVQEAIRMFKAEVKDIHPK